MLKLESARNGKSLVDIENDGSEQVRKIISNQIQFYEHVSYQPP
jgi:hypothetical protein